MKDTTTECTCEGCGDALDGSPGAEMRCACAWYESCPICHAAWERQDEEIRKLIAEGG